MLKRKGNAADLGESRIMSKKMYPKGSVLFKQGDNSRELYILNSGAMEVIVDNQTVAEIDERGSFFGELAAILNEPRNATIKTKTQCECIVIPTKYVEAVITAKPEIGLNLIKILARRLKKTTNNLALRTTQYLQETMKTRDLQNKLNNEEGVKEESRNVYDIMVRLNIINEQQLAEARSRKEKEPDKSLATILIEMKVAPMQDILDILKIYSKSFKKQ